MVPQSMAYAKLAQLPVEFGLYSSFMGVLVYWFFATSKDITIGVRFVCSPLCTMLIHPQPVAVLSQITGNVVLRVHDQLPDVPRDIIASSLAIIGGAIVLFLGLARLGWIVEFITLAAISAFMTGSAISIAAGQVPALMGITGVNTREAPYLVIINTLKYLGRSNLNAAIGLSALAMLYAIRYTCGLLARRYPSKAKAFFFVSTLRTAFVILLYILISYLCNRSARNSGGDPMFSTLGDVPRGKSLLHFLSCFTNDFQDFSMRELLRSRPNSSRPSHLSSLPPLSCSSLSISPSQSLSDGSTTTRLTPHKNWLPLV